MPVSQGLDKPGQDKNKNGVTNITNIIYNFNLNNLSNTEATAEGPSQPAQGIRSSSLKTS